MINENLSSIGMKAQEIVDQLLAHEITKEDAVLEIQAIADSFRREGAFEFRIESVAFSSEWNHGYLRLEIPYGYNRIKHLAKDGARVDVTFLP